MQFGYDANRIRTKPSFSGQRAICPLCEGILIGKCGDIYVWHWQHHHDRECDPWKEHETFWHRGWKSKFPENWQEVIIEKYNEKHRADVRTANGVVIEFQNSSISTSTIRIRENFYENMIWVVNAESFKDNFYIRSVVTSRLRNIEANASNEISSILNGYDFDTIAINDNIVSNENKISISLNNLKYKKEKLETLSKHLDEFDIFTENVLNNTARQVYFFDFTISPIINALPSELKSNLKEISEKINKQRNEIKLLEERLTAINQLDSFEIDNNIFKVISYEQINPKSFYRTKAILKKSRTTIFPEIISFKTEAEFANYQYQKTHYDFFIDPSETIKSLSTTIAQLSITILSLEGTLLTTKEDTKEKLLLLLENNIQALLNEIKDLESEHALLLKHNENLKRQLSLLEVEKERELPKLTHAIEKKKNEQRFKTMREQKGLYIFGWKYERRSWQAANNQIFFDIGEDYLFERIEEDIFKKTSISQFCNEHLLTLNSTKPEEI